MNNIAERIKQLRKEAGKSEIEVAAALDNARLKSELFHVLILALYKNSRQLLNARGLIHTSSDLFLCCTS